MELTIDAALQKAIEAHKAEQLEDADRLYTAILKVQPQHPDANHNLGVLAVSIGRVQEALPLFEAALKANPNISQFWLSYIDSLIILDRMEDAKAVFDQAKSRGLNGEKFDQIEKRLGGITKERGKIVAPAENKPQIQENILSSLSLDQAINLGKMKTEAGSPKDAKRIYEDILVRFPKNKKARKALESLKDFDAFKSFDIQDPPQEQINFIVELHSQRQTQRALEKATALLRQFPGSYILYNICGVLYQELSQLDNAVEAYTKAQQIDPDKTDAFNNMGNALKDQGKFDEAIQAYQTAITISPTNALALNNLAVIYQTRGQLVEALETYNQAIKSKPNFAEAHNNLGNTLVALGRLDAAENSYKSAIALKPDLTETHRELGNLLLRQERFEEAVASYEKVLAARPNISKVHMNVGSALAKLGQTDKAIASFKQALYLDPESADTHLRLGRTYQELGRLDDAVLSFQKAFKRRTGLNLTGEDKLAPAITSLHFELTNKCNFHCTFCPSDSQTRGIGSMDEKLIQRLYEEAADKNLGDIVSLHLMGEPTLHPKLIEILKFGASKNIKTDLVTNGSTLVAKTVPKLLDTLYGTITASHMTPTQETYEFRGNVRLSWERYIGNIRLLIREYMNRLARKEEMKCDLVIRVMATQHTASNVTITENSKEASSILKEWNDYVAGIEKELGMSRFKRKNHNDDNLLMENRHASIAYPLQKGIKLVFWRAFTFANTRVSDDFELEQQSVSHFCPAPFTDVGVLWNGDVTLCGLDHDGELKVGNIKDSSIEDVILSEKAMQLRASMLGDHPLPSLCKNCQAKPIRRTELKNDR